MTELLSAAHPRLSIRTVRSLGLRRLIAKNLSRLRFQGTSSSRLEAEWPYSTIADQTCTDRGKIRRAAVRSARQTQSRHSSSFESCRRRMFPVLTWSRLRTTALCAKIDNAKLAVQWESFRRCARPDDSARLRVEVEVTIQLIASLSAHVITGPVGIDSSSPRPVISVVAGRNRNNFGCARRRVALAADAENRRVGQKFTLDEPNCSRLGSRFDLQGRS